MLTTIIPSYAFSANFNLTPSLKVREEYNDNIFFEYADTVDDYITTVTAGLELMERTDQLDLSLKGSVSPYFYADNSEWDDVDQNYIGKIKYEVNSYLNVNADAGYNVSNRPDRDIDLTGLVQSNNRRKRQSYGLGADYELTQYSAMAVFFKYSKDEFDNGNILNQDQKDYRTGLNFVHDISQLWEETTGQFNIQFEKFDFETSDADNYFATIGIQHKFSSSVSLLIDGGVVYTDTDYLTTQRVFVPPAMTQTNIVEANNKSYSGSGQIVLDMQGEFTRGSATLRYGITPASGRGQTVQRTDGILNIRRELAEMLSVGISGGYYHNQADKDEYSANEIDEDAYYAQPTIKWEIFERFKLELGYRFTYIDDHAESNDRKQNMVYLQAGYELPLFE